MSIHISRIRAVIKQMSLYEKTLFLGCGLSLKTAHSDKFKIFSLRLPDEFLGYKPSLSALGCTFNRDLAVCYGQLCSKLARASRQTVDGVINLGVVRSPMTEGAECMLSEDPYVVSELGGGFINGAGSVVATNILSGEGAFNVRTMDARALREIYFKPVEDLGKKLIGVSIPSGTLNGVPVCAHKSFSRILWSVIGENKSVFNDLGSVINKPETTNIYASFEIGQSEKGRRDVISEVENGKLDEKRIDKCLERVISLVANRYENLKQKTDDIELDFDKVVAEQSIVLLKNDGILPLSNEPFVAIAGDLSKQERFVVKSEFANITTAKKADYVIVFAENHNGKLSQGVQKAIIEASDNGKKSILVLLSGRPIESKLFLPANAIFFVPDVFYNTFVSIVKIIKGQVNPSGKLNVSWAFNISDYPSHKEPRYLNNGDMYCYESVYNGYRYFNAFKKDVLFPFGHGLSYTNFTYSNMQTSSGNDFIELEFTVKNSGNVAGEHTCFVFGEYENVPVYGLQSRLLAFNRVNLIKSENTRVNIKIPYSRLAVYDLESSEWVIIGGTLKLKIGDNAINLPLSASFKLPFSSRRTVGLSASDVPSYYNTKDFALAKNDIDTLLGCSVNKEALEFYTAPLDITSKQIVLKKRASKKIRAALKEDIILSLVGFSEFGLLKILRAES